MFSTIQKWETRKKEVTSTNQSQTPVYYGFVCLGPPAVGTAGNLRVQLFQAADAHWLPRSFWLSIDCHTPTLCLRGDLLWRSSLENSLCWHWVWPQHCLNINEVPLSQQLLEEVASMAEHSHNRLSARWRELWSTGRWAPSMSERHRTDKPLVEASVWDQRSEDSAHFHNPDTRASQTWSLKDRTRACLSQERHREDLFSAPCSSRLAAHCPPELRVDFAHRAQAPTFIPVSLEIPHGHIQK